MSSRTEPIERGEYILTYVDEHRIEAFLRHGLAVRLVKPDLNQKCITIVVTASRAAYKAAKSEQREPSHNPTPQLSDEREQLRRQDDTEETWRVRIADASLDTVKTVCHEHGLRGKVIKFHPLDNFSVVNIKTTRKQFRTAQLDWIQRLISNAPKVILTHSEPDIFA